MKGSFSENQAADYLSLKCDVLSRLTNFSKASSPLSHRGYSSYMKSADLIEWMLQNLTVT